MTSGRGLRAADIVWDPSGTGGSDASGTWNLSTANWFNGGATVWPNTTGNVAVFGSGGSGAFTVTLGDDVIAGGIRFNAGPTYTIGGAHTINLDNSPTITVNAATAGIAAPIIGSSGLTVSGTGALTLSGSSGFTGTVLQTSGTLIAGGPGAFGAATNPLIMGSSPASLTNTVPVNLSVQANNTVASLVVNSSNDVAALNGTANQLVIAPGATLTVAGPMTVGLGSATTATNTSLRSYAGTTSTPGAGGSLAVSGTVTIGVQNTNATSTKNATLADLSALTSFTQNAPAGTLDVGAGTNILGRLILANNANLINVSQVRVGTSTAITGGNNNANPGSTITLGAGTNTIETGALLLGNGKSNGIMQFGSASGSVSILGTNGTGTTAITLSNQTVATGAVATSSLLLAGHQANVSAGAVIVGQSAGNTASISTAALTFDTGTFTASSLALAVVSGTASGATVGSNGTFTLGSAGSAGVLNVNGPFTLGGDLGTGTTTSATATFTINGGTANVGANIKVTSTKGTTTSTINLNGGVLNMSGFQIGGASAVNGGDAAIGTLSLPAAGNTATIANLGGNGIYATAGSGASTTGVTMNSAGTLALAGVNTYAGPTTVSQGTLQVGSGTLGGSLPAGSVVTNNSAMTFGGSVPMTISNAIGGSGSIAQVGTGNTALTGTSTFSGSATVSAGTLSVNGVLPSGGAVNVSGGTLAGTGSVGNVSLSAGAAIHPGATGVDGVMGTLSTASLTAAAGDMRFDVGGAASDAIAVGGAASLAGSTLSISLTSAPTVPSYTLLTASGGISGTPTLATPNIGRTMFSLNTVGNSLMLGITGGPATLTWGHAGTGDGTTWDNTQSNLNWSKGGAADTFYDADIVSFTDNNAGHFGVNITSAVTPGSVVFSNNSGNYVISGNGGIIGNTGVSVTETGKVTLGATNAFTGGVSISGGGTLAAGSTTGIPATAGVKIAGGTLDLNGLAVTVGGLSDSGASAGNVIGNGSTTAAATLVIGSGSSVFGGVIKDAVGSGTQTTGLQVSGGSLTLTGNSTYTGPTAIGGGGQLGLGNGGTTGSVASGTISFTSSSGVAGTLAVNRSDAANIANGIANAGSTAGVVSQVGSGLLTLSGAQTMGVGGINYAVGAGNAVITGGVDGSAGGKLTKSGTGTLTLGGTADDVALGATVSGGTLVLAKADPTAHAIGAGGLTIGTGGITQLAAGGNGDQIYNGLGSGIVTIQSGGTFDLNGQSETIDRLTFAGSGVGGVGAITNSAPNTTVTLTITSNTSDGSSVTITAASGATINLPDTFSNSANSGQNITVTGAGSVVFGGTVDNFGSGVVVNGGTAVFSKVGSSAAVHAFGSGVVINNGGTGKLGSDGSGADQFYDGMTVTLNAGGTFDMNGINETIGRLLMGAGTLTSTGSGVATLTATTLTFTGNATVAAVAGATLGITQTAGAPTTGITGAFGMTKVGAGTVSLNSANSFTGGATVNAGNLVFNAVNALPDNSALTVNGGTATFANLGGITVTHLASLTMGSAGSVDVTRNVLVVRGSTLATVTGEVKTGYAGGTWAGPGILSSLAAADGTGLYSVGVVVNDNGEGGTLFDSVDGGPTVLGDVVVKYTYAGDTDLSGQVDSNDLANLLAGMSGHLSGWINGDVNYDGVVDSHDKDLLVYALANQGAPLGSGTGGFGGAVPEPSGLSLGLIALPLLGRRRRAAR